MAGTDPVRSVIVDDSDRFIHLVSRLLVADGFDVVGTAGDSEQALRLVADLCPDVMFVDLYLGEDNGIELISDIACSGLAEGIFLILVSSCATEDLREIF